MPASYLKRDDALGCGSGPSRPANGRRMAFVLALAALAVLTVAPARADAQYFGRNKVQYRTFNFDVLKTEHYDIHYYPE